MSDSNGVLFFTLKDYMCNQSIIGFDLFNSNLVHFNINLVFQDIVLTIGIYSNIYEKDFFFATNI